MKIYISGKISGIEKEAIKIFQASEDYLIESGYQAVNPMKLNDEHDKSWESYMKVCIKALCDCDRIYMISNWTDSRGAKIELEIAKHLGIEVIYETR